MNAYTKNMNERIDLKKGVLQKLQRKMTNIDLLIQQYSATMEIHKDAEHKYGNDIARMEERVRMADELTVQYMDALQAEDEFEKANPPGSVEASTIDPASGRIVETEEYAGIRRRKMELKRASNDLLNELDRLNTDVNRIYFGKL